MNIEKRSGKNWRISERRSLPELTAEQAGFPLLQRDRRNRRQRRNCRQKPIATGRRILSDRRTFPFLTKLVGRNEAIRLVSNNN